MKYYTLKTPPTAEPLSLADACAFLRISTGCEDVLVRSLIATAREIVENFTGRALAAEVWTLAADSWCIDRITLDRTPLVSVESVKYLPEGGGALVTLSGSDYAVITATQPGTVLLLIDPPALADRPDAIQIEFTAGSATSMNATLRHALLLLVGHLYELRTPVNVGNIVNEIPMSLRHILESQRVGGWIA